MNDADLFERVRKTIEDTLALEPSQVALITPDTNLVHDLKAESLDFLDLLFRLEDEFGVVLPQREFQDAERLGLTEKDLAHADGTLTEAAIAKLRTILPEADPKRLAPGLKKNEIVRVLTVRSFMNLVRRKLDSKQGASA